MGKGIALQFKNEFPHNYKVYQGACKSHLLQIGNLLTVIDRSLLMGERLIINFPTKSHWRLPSEYTYIRQGLIALAKVITEKNIKYIALPALGCGNGRLEWMTVKRLIINHLDALDAYIQIYEPTYY